MSYMSQPTLCDQEQWRLDMYDIEANLLQQIEGVLELCLRFSTEADNHVRGEGKGRPQFAYSFNTFTVFIQSVAALHTLQHAVIASLHRNVEMLAHFREVGHTLNHAIGHMTGIRCHKADALQAIDLAQVGHQVGQVWLLREI